MRHRPRRAKRVADAAVVRVGELRRRQFAGLRLVAMANKTSRVPFLRQHLLRFRLHTLNLSVTIRAERTRAGSELSAIRTWRADRSYLEADWQSLSVSLVRKDIFKLAGWAGGEHAGVQRFVRAGDAALFVAYAAEAALARSGLEDFGRKIVTLDARSVREVFCHRLVGIDEPLGPARVTSGTLQPPVFFLIMGKTRSSSSVSRLFRERVCLADAGSGQPETG